MPENYYNNVVIADHVRLKGKALLKAAIDSRARLTL
jgi:hypothetical protein